MRTVLISIIGFSLMLSLIVGCSGADDKEDAGNLPYSQSSDLRSFVFPTDSVQPYIYAFSDIYRPVDEKFFRIYQMEENDTSKMLVERYNRNFQITEGYTFAVEYGFEVVDHMVVDGNGLKRKAHVTEQDWFVLDTSMQSSFVSDFPAHLDSTLVVYKSKKHFDRFEQKYEVLGDTVPAIVVRDSITFSLVNPTSKKGSVKSVVTNRVYAQNYGLVAWYDLDDKVHYKLKKILSNEWWETFAQ